MKVLVLVGPTASGKTEIALHLARILDGEIVSADSRQVYKYLDIGTAKPDKNQRKSIPHYFVDELDPRDAFNAAIFGTRGREVLREILSRGKTAIVSGGSGLYIRSLIDGLFEGPGADPRFRKKMERLVLEDKLQELLDLLKRVDPQTAATIDPTKPRRVIRALEVHHATGRPISAHHREMKSPGDIRAFQYGLRWDRQELYRRIELRCEEMIAAGLMSEVEALERMGLNTSVNALNTVGYREAFAYREGAISFSEMTRLFKQNSRRYAKRQETWFRADTRIEWIEMNGQKNSGEVAREIERRFRDSRHQGSIASHPDLR